MKATKNNRATLIFLLIIMGIIGTISWEILERILTYFDIFISLAVKGIGFDLSVISLYITPNPGTVIGVGTGFFLFRRL